jgi:hypothetical protein
MNRIELQKKLGENGIPKTVYCLDGGLPWEQYCLEENYGKWSVYYSERGNKSSLKIFYNENEACSYLFDWIMKEAGPRYKKL